MHSNFKSQCIFPQMHIVNGLADLHLAGQPNLLEADTSLPPSLLKIEMHDFKCFEYPSKTLSCPGLFQQDVLDTKWL